MLSVYEALMSADTYYACALDIGGRNYVIGQLRLSTV